MRGSTDRKRERPRATPYNSNPKGHREWRRLLCRVDLSQLPLLRLYDSTSDCRKSTITSHLTTCMPERASISSPGLILGLQPTRLFRVLFSNLSSIFQLCLFQVSILRPHLIFNSHICIQTPVVSTSILLKTIRAKDDYLFLFDFSFSSFRNHRKKKYWLRPKFSFKT